MPLYQRSVVLLFFVNTCPIDVILLQCDIFLILDENKHHSSHKEPNKSFVQPIANRVAQNLEFILFSQNFQFSTRRTRFIIYYLVLIVNPMGRILVR